MMTTAHGDGSLVAGCSVLETHSRLPPDVAESLLAS